MKRSCSPSTAAYFDLTGGLERWLYRLVRKHGGRQAGGWSFDFVHLHAKSGSLSPLKHFAYDLREIVRRQTSAWLSPRHRRGLRGAERLNFTPIRCRSAHGSGCASRGLATCIRGQAVNSSRAIGDRNSRAIGDPILVLSGTEITT